MGPLAWSSVNKEAGHENIRRETHDGSDVGNRRARVGGRSLRLGGQSGHGADGHRAGADGCHHRRAGDKIDGDVYTVLRSYSDNGGSNPSRGFGGALTEKQFRVYVGKETTKIKGEKKVGDKIRAEVTRGGFANSIQ